MRNKEELRQRFLRDSLPTRLGGLAAALARVSSSARDSSAPEIVPGLLEESKHLIEWTAADTAPSVAAELVQMQRLIALWQRAWQTASKHQAQRVLLSVQAKAWSDRALEVSGLAS